VAPYRSVSEEQHAEAPRDAGIVGDIIAQFADPLAFYRELVQNAIDADSASVEVELVHDTRVMMVRVRDRGCGMTRDILENQLLVLFRSTKEKDSTKIGKFGIGFASVLSPNPNVVVVSTARDGRRLVLHLSRDLTFKLFDGGAATQTGTVIELELVMTVEEAHEFAQRSHDALVRWCRHASVPITLRTEIPGLEPAYAARIDRPLGLDDAVVEVRGVSDDRQMQMIVGIARDAKPYGGFFNHGLMLYETTERLIGKLAFKIQDPRLGHTLSRDNVRRDENFTRALQMTRTLAEDQLPRVIETALRTACLDEPGKWEALAGAVVWSEIGLEPRRWTFPLVDATPQSKMIDAGQIGRRMWVAPTSTPLTAALASAGIPIVRIAAYARETFDKLRALISAEVVDVATAFTIVTPVEPTPMDQVFCDTLLQIFEACHRGPSRVVLATIEGAFEDLLAVAGGPEDAAFPAQGDRYVLDKDVAGSTPFSRTRRRPVVINAGHPLVRIARTSSDPRMAAAHLARGVLLQNRILDVDKSRAILEYTLTRVTRGPA
jgi:Histidine kinase-, DNA gyrase B-, and HSP90-like ATPase